MPEEIEVPTEHLHEQLHEAAHGHGHGHGRGAGHGGGPSWVNQVALSAAMLAVAAAVTALLAGHHANEAMLEQMQATDNWAYFQAKGIKATLVENKMDVLVAVGKEPREEDRKKVTQYRHEQKEIEDKAHEEERASTEHMQKHVVFARAVTGYQVAIAMSAISVLTKKRAVWYLGLVLGVVGTALFVQAVVS